MTTVRRDSKGRVLRKGESFKKSKQLYVYSYTDIMGKRRCVYAKDLSELRIKEDHIQKNKLDKFDVYCIGKAEINYVFDRYLATKTNLRGTTKSNYMYTYDRYVRDGFGKNRLEDVKFSDIILFYNSILEKGLSINTVDNIHGLLHPTFELAVRDRILRSNPSNGALAEIKKNIRKPDKKYALALEEETAFLKYLDDKDNKRWKPLFVFMFGTGVRVGELIGLRWCDLDFDNRVISINHNIAYYQKAEKNNKCGFDVYETKTAAGVRTIPMLDQVYDALIEEKNNQKEYGYHSIVEIGGLKDFVFCNRFGNVHNASALNRVIKRIVDDYNAKEEVRAWREKREPLILPRFSCHIIRHTFCTRLCENDVNIKVIQSVMGHKDVQTTLNIYADVSERRKMYVFRDLSQKIILEKASMITSSVPQID